MHVYTDNCKQIRTIIWYTFVILYLKDHPLSLQVEAQVAVAVIRAEMAVVAELLQDKMQSLSLLRIEMPLKG